MKGKTRAIHRITLCGGAFAFGLAALPVWAQEDGGASSSSQINFSYSGSLRTDFAVSTAGENPYNQTGNLFNGKPVERTSALGTDTATRNGVSEDNDFNLLLLRGELRGDLKLPAGFGFTAKLRAVFDPAVYDEFDPGAVGSHAVGHNYGEPNYFNYSVEGRDRSSAYGYSGSGHSRPNPLEWNGEQYMIDLPSFYASYANGPLALKLGNQDIAWGQAIFFRVLDVPNGLDMRRHSLLDYASEEFQDKRMPSLALRATYQIDSSWLADAYVQKFQPTVLSNPNTPYNVISSQFTIHDRYGDYDDKVNYGLRLKGDIGQFGVQAVVARRYNPDGVYRWTESGVNRSSPGMDAAAGGTDAGPLLAMTPFEIDPTGVWSSTEWYTYAAMARLDGTAALNAAINEFPVVDALADPVSSKAAADATLNTFFALSGSGLRGHLAREYFVENNFGLGASYVTEAEPGSWLDQLIINVETLYTPNRRFTNPSLSRNYLVEDEWTSALVMEKYQSVLHDLPATYFVLQYLYKSQSDLFGRSLEGMGGDVNNTPRGMHGYNAIAFALQQPFPNLIWRADLAVLYEPSGGILVQPGVRWKPSGNLTVEAFYNFLQGKLNGNPNRNALSTVDYADELTLRLGYQF